MNRRVAVALAGFAAATVAAQAPALAQNFPDHPVKIVVPYPAGGPADTVARVTTQGLGVQLGGSVIIEDVPGAGGRLATKDVTRAAPDGYTLLLGSSNEYAITPALYKNLEYDPVKDLTAVAALVTDSVAIVVNPSVPVHSLKELAAYAKEHPGKLTSGSTVGIIPHLALMYFQVHMGADIVFVPYKGAAPALADCMGNQISALFQRQVSAGAAAHQRQAARACGFQRRALARGSRRADIPRSGLDGFPPQIVFGLLAPTGTPPEIIAKVNAAENALLKTPETQAAIAKLGLHPLVLSPQGLGKALTDELHLWRAVINEAGVHVD